MPQLSALGLVFANDDWWLLLFVVVTVVVLAVLPKLAVVPAAIAERWFQLEFGPLEEPSRAVP